MGWATQNRSPVCPYRTFIHAISDGFQACLAFCMVTTVEFRLNLAAIFEILLDTGNLRARITESFLSEAQLVVRGFQAITKRIPPMGGPLRESDHQFILALDRNQTRRTRLLCTLEDAGVLPPLYWRTDGWLRGVPSRSSTVHYHDGGLKRGECTQKLSAVVIRQGVCARSISEAPVD